MRLSRSFTTSLLSGTRWRSPGCSRCPQCPSPPATINRRHTYGTSSSEIWLKRQLRDPFTKKATILRFRSRAAFKLLEIHDNHNIFRPGQTVVDLVPRPLPFSPAPHFLLSSTLLPAPPATPSPRPPALLLSNPPLLPPRASPAVACCRH